MQITWKKTESLTMPLEIDTTSSPSGIYIRRNIEEITNEYGTKYQYDEVFLTKSEYEIYSKELLVNAINGEDNTAEYEEYKNKLNTGVQYTNGKFYKPKWAAIYSQKINEILPMLNAYKELGSDISIITGLKINVYDITATVENAEEMNIKEIIELWLFLIKKQEQFFNEYKQSLNQ